MAQSVHIVLSDSDYKALLDYASRHGFDSEREGAAVIVEKFLEINCGQTHYEMTPKFKLVSSG